MTDMDVHEDEIPRLYSAKQVEEALGVRGGTVHSLVALGVLKPAPIPGKRLKFTTRAVRMALEADPMGRACPVEAARVSR